MNKKTLKKGLLKQDALWACGLIESDGHISLEWTDKQKTRWVPILKVSLKSYNARAVYALKAILGVGRITFSQGFITLRVRRRSHWKEVLLPFMAETPLRSYKTYQVQLIKSALREELSAHEAKTALKRTEVLKTKPLPSWPTLAAGYPLPWLAGFIEGDGSFYMLQNGQHGFALGQKDVQAQLISRLHARLNVPSTLKMSCLGYGLIDSKNQAWLEKLGQMLKPHMRGIKSAELGVWLRSLRTSKMSKKLKARHILHKIRGQTRFSS